MPQDPKANVLEKVLAEVRSGLVSSVAAEAVLFPLDTVKLRQQVNGGTAVQVLKTLLREQGPRGLYQGLFGRLIQTITSNVGFFVWQTIFIQLALQQVARTEDDDLNDLAADSSKKRLSTGVSLVVNMLAQQINRILTTPVDVVANVNQADPSSKGFFHTFARLARTGGRATLWRGLAVSLLLSLNPAMMFTLVGKLSGAVARIRDIGVGHLSAGDLFWISGASKAVATLVTYPLIRAKAMMQSGSSAPSGLLVTLSAIVKNEGFGGLYSGVGVMSYKTVLFNSLMMALKQKITKIFEAETRPLRRRRSSLVEKWAWMKGNFRYRPQLHVLARERNPQQQTPWDAAARGERVVYVDGSWAFLHEAQEHVIQEAARRGEHLVVGIHSDTCLHEVTGQYPQECFAARVARLRTHNSVSSILEDAPWDVPEDLVQELGVCAVVSGSITKTEDTALPSPISEDGRSDPYKECKRLRIYEEVKSLNASTEHQVWIDQAARVLFSNVDASIDWRILVADGAKAVFGQNPGYPAELSPRARSAGGSGRSSRSPSLSRQGSSLSRQPSS